MSQKFNYQYVIQDHYLVPKVLVTDEKYSNLNSTAILLYTLLLEKTENHAVDAGWIDNDGHLYVIFSSQHMLDMLNISSSKLSRIKKQLVAFDLIEIKRQGLGEYDKIYVKQIG